MATQRHLRNAPLAEALLDIQVIPRDGLSISEFDRLDPALAGRYKRRGTKRQGGFEVQLDMKVDASESIAKSRSVPIGYLYADETGKRLLQASVGGFTQNILKPYPTFEVLIEEAKTNWAKYIEVAQPTAISRIALRYINDLRLPITDVHFEDFLTASPIVPAGLPQTVSDFATRVTIDNHDLGAKAIVNQLFQGVVDDQGVQVILDIDAISDRPLEARDPKLWDRVSQLRQFKNDIFFSFVTEKLLERYQ